MTNSNQTLPGEIDLAQLLRNIFSQWKIIAIITVIGCLAGISICLYSPKLYRVAVILDRPSTSDLYPLIAQPFIELDSNTIFTQFLVNLKSQAITEQALENTGFFTKANGAALTEQERSAIAYATSNNIRISAIKFDSARKKTDELEILNKISVSLLTPKPIEEQIILAELIKLAKNKTTEYYKNEILSKQKILITQLNSQLSQINSAAKYKRESEIQRLQNALNIANALDIVNPEATNTNESNSYLKGIKILTAELSNLKEAPLDLDHIIVSYNETGIPVTLSANSIQGQIDVYSAFTSDLTNITYTPEKTRINIPATAEKPNRKLIVMASTGLFGIFGLFLVIIRIVLTSHP